MIPYTKPSITDLELSLATDAVRDGWGEKCYDYIYKFEKSFAEYVGVKYALSTSSCTGALTLGLAAIDLCSTDEVILADTNWVATVAPIVQLGAVPVFVDIDPLTWCIDPKIVEKKITPRTKAIIATHLYGNLADISALKVLCKQNNIFLIEDAAEALGSKYGNKFAGSEGDFSTFSFHGTKTMTTGEGGMLVTNNTDLFDRAKELNNHGRSSTQDKLFWADSIGYKFKMSNVQAAIGCAQMLRLNELVERKRQILNFYRKHLEKISGLRLNFESPGCRIGAWMPNLVFDKELNICREELIEVFKQANIDARPFFWPLSELPMFESCAENFNSRDIASRSINLPSYHDMSDEQCEEVVQVVRNIVDSSNLKR